MDLSSLTDGLRLQVVLTDGRRGVLRSSGHGYMQVELASSKQTVHVRSAEVSLPSNAYAPPVDLEALVKRPRDSPFLFFAMCFISVKEYALQLAGQKGALAGRFRDVKYVSENTSIICTMFFYQ